MEEMTADNEKFQNNYKLLQEAIRKAQDMLFIKNTDFEYVAVSDPFARMVGKTPEEIVGKQDYDLFADRQLAEKYRNDDARILAGRQNIYDMVEPLPAQEGQPQFATTSKELLMGYDGKPAGIMGVSRDLGQLRSAQQHFWTELKEFMNLGENDFYAMIADLSEWKVLDRTLNPKCNISPKTDLNLDEIIASARNHVNPEAAEALEFYQNFSAQYLFDIYQGGKSQVVLEYLHDLSNDVVQWMQDIIYLRTNPENGHLFAIMILHSVEEQRQKALRLRREAETDSLTGLLNRHYFITKTKKFLTYEGASGTHAFFMIDVDDFKKVNDTFGHQTGDKFLETLAKVLQKCFRNDDMIARLGGDEFVALMKDVPHREKVLERVNQIIRETRQAVIQAAGVEPSISVGISMYPADGTTLEELYGNADIALYKAKRKRNNSVEFYGQD